MRELKKEDGTVISGHAAISTELRGFFENIYNNEEDVSQENMEEMIRDIPSLISPEDSQFLETPISEDEIKKAIWTLSLDKAPGPDGFPI